MPDAILLSSTVNNVSILLCVFVCVYMCVHVCGTRLDKSQLLHTHNSKTHFSSSHDSFGDES